MEECPTISKLPRMAVVYALYAGNGSTSYVVYVGYTQVLKTRIGQHLVARDSSINTASAAARLNPERITEVRWWVSPEFLRNGKPQLLRLKAAELVAFGKLDPVLRSNARPDRNAEKLSKQVRFKRKMENLFGSEAQGCWRRPHESVILAEIDDLKKRMDAMESRLGSAKV